MSHLAPTGYAGRVAAMPRLHVSARNAASAPPARPPPADPAISTPIAGRNAIVAVPHVDFAAESAEQLLARYQLALQALIARLYGQPVKSLIDITA